MTLSYCDICNKLCIFHLICNKLTTLVNKFRYISMSWWLLWWVSQWRRIELCKQKVMGGCPIVSDFLQFWFQTQLINRHWILIVGFTFIERQCKPKIRFEYNSIYYYSISNWYKIRLLAADISLCKIYHWVYTLL